MNIFYEIRQYLINKKYFILGLIIFLIIIISFYFNLNNKEEVVVKNIEKKEVVKKEETQEEKCMVDIKGYINNSGLYEVNCNNRVNDIINLAGGLKENANTTVINLSKKVFDQMVIVIYSNEEVNDFVKVKEEETKKEEKCVSSSVVGNDACIKKEDRIETRVIISSDNKSTSSTNITSTPSSNKLISINTASKEELMNLTGIGESKALAIIKYREEHGLFNTIEDIKNVTGIGDKMFEKIKDSITV